MCGIGRHWIPGSSRLSQKIIDLSKELKNECQWISGSSRLGQKIVHLSKESKNKCQWISASSRLFVIIHISIIIILRFEKALVFRRDFTCSFCQNIKSIATVS